MECFINNPMGSIRRPCRTVTLPITKLVTNLPRYAIEVTKSDGQITKCKVRGLTHQQANQLKFSTMLSSYGSYNVRINQQCDGNYNIVVTTDCQFHPDQVTHIADCIKVNIPGSVIQCYYR